MKELFNCKFVTRTVTRKTGYSRGKRKVLVVTGVKQNGIRVYTSECLRMVGNVLETRNGRSWWVVGEIQ